MFLKWSRKSWLITPVLTGLVGLMFAATLWQPEATAKPETLGKVFYDPSSGSYFEYIRNIRGFRRWGDVRPFVNKRIYKGNRGRLAVIKTRATHEFLRKNLGIPSDSWIGLRYHCSSGKLVWVTGDKLKRGVDLEIWYRKLYYEGRSLCGRIRYLVAYYKVIGKRLYWQLSGPEHGLGGAVIEYPTR